MLDVSIVSKVTVPAPYAGRAFVHPRIPPDLLRRALRRCPLVEKDEVPLVLLDLTQRGWFKRPGRHSVVLTTRRIYDAAYWPSDMFLPAVRAMPLTRIVSVGLEDSFAGAGRVHVNGYPLMGVTQPEFDGLSDKEFLLWVVELIRKLTNGQQAAASRTSADVVLSYESLLKLDGPFNHLFYSGRVPTPFLRNAMASYAPVACDPSEVLLLFNDSGKGKTGVVITSDTLFSSSGPQESCFSWRLESIRKVWVGHAQTPRTLNLYVIIDNRRVFGWPHSQQGEFAWQALRRPVFAFANMVVALRNLSRSDSDKLRYPVESVKLLDSGVNFRAAR